MSTNIKTNNMKAIELLQKSIQANLSIAETYHEKADFFKYKKDDEKFKENIDRANDFLKSAKECEEAIEEINELLKNN